MAYTLKLVGIGSGNPKHLTLEAIEALNSCDAILIPHKGADKDDLAGLRRQICADVLTGDTPIHEFTLPIRDEATTDYRQRVDDWHDAIAAVWLDAMQKALPSGGTVGFLVWGDPSLYDSTLRIADRLTKQTRITTQVIPGITSIQTLTAGHAIPLNRINGPFTITTGRQLRDNGWPNKVDTVVVMLDGACSFRHLDPTGITIYWTAFAGMPNEIRRSGPLSDITQDIIETRAEARKKHGWCMDIYLLRKDD
ncbi:precorrin-6A synthase (deacetylating) [Donghicola tyrosinivorans]|uniref:Precorrin-6A synthase [deacetylating] n=1 Tax=Donghicola tyrosinivorans TaxID=1652492 RepID=A0A2T0WJJ2_9RHOB|nr:precorrin-6A synthase (deacetylating) [Donghicola tyrosinivorans]PRY86883.1 precorrin-6A synthase [Donghicola tyrosinivorans]